MQKAECSCLPYSGSSYKLLPGVPDFTQRHLPRLLVLYPENVWNEQMNELRCKLNRWNSRHQMIFRQFVSDVEVITLDGNGRFLIPKRYLKLAKIQQDVRFIGLDDTIEIWSKEIADKPFITPEDFGKELEEIMGTNNNVEIE